MVFSIYRCYSIVHYKPIIIYDKSQFSPIAESLGVGAVVLALRHQALLSAFGWENEAVHQRFIS